MQLTPPQFGSTQTGEGPTVETDGGRSEPDGLYQTTSGCDVMFVSQIVLPLCLPFQALSVLCGTGMQRLMVVALFGAEPAKRLITVQEGLNKFWFSFDQS
jgi:hypothetical protein